MMEAKGGASMYQIALCDDEVAAVKVFAPQITATFEKLGCPVTLTTFNDPCRFLESLQAGNAYHAVFLDIDMPRLDGIALGKKLRELDYSIAVVFVSSRTERVFETFAVQPLRFLRKSRFSAELPDAAREILRTLEKAKTQTVTFGDATQSFCLPVADIRYCEIVGKTLSIHLPKNTVNLRYRMSDAEEQLQPYGFLRIHKGYLVNCAAIFCIRKDCVELTNGEILPLSRRRSEEFMEKIFAIHPQSGAGAWSMSTYIYLFFKYTLEAAMLDFAVAYACRREWRESFRRVASVWWLILLTAAAELALHWVTPGNTFALRYFFTNYASTALFWRIAIHEKGKLARVVGTYCLVCVLFLQTFATYFVFALPSLASQIEHFGWKEDFISNGSIWLTSAFVIYYVLRRVRGIYDFEGRDPFFINLFAWVLFGTTEILTFSVIDPNGYFVVAVVILLLFLAETMLYLAMSVTMVRERIRNVEQRRIHQQYDLLSQHMEDVQRLYRSMRETRHEMKNQFHYIKELLKQQRYAELCEYIGEQETQLLPAFQAFDSGNSLVNAIIWSKREQAEQAGIDFRVQAALPPDLPVKGHHLCSVLVNLLNNAMEACANVPEPSVDLTLRIQQGYLYACVTNSICGDILAENPDLRTTKRDVLDHGYGIKNIRAVTQQYGGMSEFTVENGRFVATVMLLLPQPSEIA